MMQQYCQIERCTSAKRIVFDNVQVLDTSGIGLIGLEITPTHKHSSR